MMMLMPPSAALTSSSFLRWQVMPEPGCLNNSCMGEQRGNIFGDGLLDAKEKCFSRRWMSCSQIVSNSCSLGEKPVWPCVQSVPSGLSCFFKIGRLQKSQLRITGRYSLFRPILSAPGPTPTPLKLYWSELVYFTNIPWGRKRHLLWDHTINSL